MKNKRLIRLLAGICAMLLTVALLPLSAVTAATATESAPQAQTADGLEELGGHDVYTFTFDWELLYNTTSQSELCFAVTSVDDSYHHYLNMVVSGAKAAGTKGTASYSLAFYHKVVNGGWNEHSSIIAAETPIIQLLPKMVPGFAIDNFTVEKNGQVLYTTDFSDGMPAWMQLGDHAAVNYSTAGVVNGRFVADRGSANMDVNIHNWHYQVLTIGNDRYPIAWRPSGYASESIVNGTCVLDNGAGNYPGPTGGYFPVLWTDEDVVEMPWGTGHTYRLEFDYRTLYADNDGDIHLQVMYNGVNAVDYLQTFVGGGNVPYLTHKVIDLDFNGNGVANGTPMSIRLIAKYYAGVAFDNVKITRIDQATGHKEVIYSETFGADVTAYEGWAHVAQNGGAAADRVIYNSASHAVTLSAMDGNTQFLYLNRGDSSAANLTKFSAAAMSDFTVEFDVAVKDYYGKAAVDGGDVGAGGGAVGLAFMGANADSLQSASVMASINYSTVGLLMNDYPGITMPESYTANYVDAQFSQWHWLFNNGSTNHVKLVKVGRTITMDVNNGYQTFTATLPADYPSTGYIGFFTEYAEATFSNVQVTNTTPSYEATEVFFVEQYEGWCATGNGTVSYNTATHALDVNAVGGTKSLYLNKLTNAAYSAEEMTDFVVEFDAALRADSLQRGSISLAFMGKDSARLDISAITARVDPTNIGFMWRNYHDIQMPGSYGYSYVDTKVTQYHWRFHATEIFHVKVSKVGYAVRMQVTNSTGASVSDISVTLPSNIGLPEAGLVGFLVEDTAITISDVEVTNTTAGQKAYTRFFTNPKANLLGSYEGWQYATTGNKNGITYSEVYRELHINAMDGQVHSLLLNRETGDGVNSSAANLEKFGVDTMQDFTVEFDLVVNNFSYKDDGDNGTGSGKFGLSFLSESSGRLDVNSLTAQIGYADCGVYWNGYRDIAMPSGYTNNYVNGLNAKPWHWLFNTAEPRHVKIVKSGNTVTMDVLNGYVNATYTLPNTLPASGYIGLVAQNVDVTVTNLKVANTTAGNAATATFFAPPVLVASEVCNGRVTMDVYEKAEGGHMLVVSGTGSIPAWTTLNVYKNYAATIDTLVIQEGITEVGSSAFAKMAALKSVTFPSSVTKLAYGAFMNTGLTSVVIPDTVKTMGKWVFANCKSLETAVMGDGLKRVFERTFSGCSALKSVEFGSKVTLIDNYAFFNCGLENLYIPASVTTTGSAAFRSCSNLKTVVIAKDGGMKKLGWATFYKCSSLVSVDLGNTLTTIASWNFTACPLLKSVVIPDTVTSIARCTFKWCAGLETVELSENLTAISDELFSNCGALKSVAIPAGVTEIGANAFYRCKSLNKVYVNSASVLESLTSPDAAGQLAKFATILVIRNDIGTVPAFITDSYPYVGYQTVNGVKCTLYGKRELTVEDGCLDGAFAPYVNADPAVKYVTSYDPTRAEWKNIKAVTYEGALRGGQKTKVFAYIGFPEGASATNKVPAVVLVHGGGGHAFAEWVKIWNDRGYAAIAMDTTGFFPSEAGKGIAGAESDNVALLWQHGLHGEFAEEGYVGIPDNDSMTTSSKPLDQQWMYHAVVSTMMAHNILQNDSRVAADQIGITGISWGGVITSLAIGYDTDYSFAIPIYGSGYLNESHAWQGPIFAEEKTEELWSAADRFDRVNFPVYWLCWADDNCFSVNSNSKSYLDTKAAGAVLNMKQGMGHSHGLGWNPKDSYAFADSIVGKRPAFTKVIDEPTVVKNGDGTYSVTMTISRDVSATGLSATAYYINQPLSYSSPTPGSWPLIDQTWKPVSCSVNGNTVTVTLPAEAKDFYITVTTTSPTGTYDVCSQFVQGIG